MSLILDALNRADTERKNQTPVPDLNTQHRPWRWNRSSLPVHGIGGLRLR
jgi:general secretion pathway protein B